MGIGPFKSTSSCGCGCGITSDAAGWVAVQPGNPDPQEFTITSVEQHGYYLICRVTYQDCTNYEGRKILVFRGVTEQQLRQSKELDPHFCGDGHVSPVARFVPTPEGLRMARTLVKAL